MSVLLVALQLGLIAALFLTGPALARSWPGRAAELAGVLLGLWAVWCMRRSKLRVTPEVAPGAVQITAGPYRRIRHPMYAAGLLLTGALVADAPSPPRLALWAALAAVLVVKLLREERFLRARFSEYAGYSRRTARLVPGLW